MAQQSTAPASAAAEPPIEEVVVTGSRILQSEQGFANPVTTFSAAELAQSGKTDIPGIGGFEDRQSDRRLQSWLR